MELTCNYCPHCTCVDHEGYGKCSRKGNTVVKTGDPACDDLNLQLTGTRWRDSFGNKYVFVGHGFVPETADGTFLTCDYIEKLYRIDKH